MTGLNGAPLALFLLLIVAAVLTTVWPVGGVNFIFWWLALSVFTAFGLAAILHKGVRP